MCALAPRVPVARSAERASADGRMAGIARRRGRGRVQRVRAQGAGGQNVNKVSSAVHLRFDVAASSLPEAVKARLLALRDQRISDDGVVVIKAQRHRSQEPEPARCAGAAQRAGRARRRGAAARASRRGRRAPRSERRLEGKSVRAQVKAGRAKVVE